MTDFILLPGYKLNDDGSPAKELCDRADRAYEVWRELRVPVICCGGDAAGTGVTEAEVLRVLLTDRGVPDKDIIKEDRSFITAENFANAAAICGKGRHAALVTSDYHMARAKLLARKAGFRVKGFKAPTPKDSLRRNRGILEFMGIIDALCGWQTGKTRPAAVERFKKKLFQLLIGKSSTSR